MGCGESMSYLELSPSGLVQRLRLAAAEMCAMAEKDAGAVKNMIQDEWYFVDEIVQEMVSAASRAGKAVDLIDAAEMLEAYLRLAVKSLSGPASRNGGTVEGRHSGGPRRIYCPECGCEEHEAHGERCSREGCDA